MCFLRIQIILHGARFKLVLPNCIGEVLEFFLFWEHFEKQSFKTKRKLRIFAFFPALLVLPDLRHLEHDVDSQLTTMWRHLIDIHWLERLRNTQIVYVNCTYSSAISFVYDNENTFVKTRLVRKIEVTPVVVDRIPYGCCTTNG